MQEGEEVSSSPVDPEDGSFQISDLPPGTYDLVAEGEGVTISPERIDGVVVVAGQGTEGVVFTITEATGGEGDGTEGEAITLDNVAEVWGQALVAISRLQGEMMTPGAAAIAGEIAGEANVSLEIDALAGTATHTITFAAYADDGELMISGEIAIVATSGSEELTYTGTLEFDGAYFGEASVDMSGTVEGTSGTLEVGGEELVVE